jgi:hypothetical protein
MAKGLDEKRYYPSVKLYQFCYNDPIAIQTQCLLREMGAAGSRGATMVHRIQSNSCLVDKQRSIALTDFMRNSNEEVAFFLDHDMQWGEGDMMETARLAYELKSVVGCVASKRAFGKGTNLYVDKEEAEDGEVVIGSGEHIPRKCTTIGTGFMAIDRSVPERLWATYIIYGDNFKKRLKKSMKIGLGNKVMDMCEYGIRECNASGHEGLSSFIGFFAQMTIRSENGEHYRWLGEDVSFCARCVGAGIQPYFNTRPKLIHHGRHAYTLQDAMTKWPPGGEG